MSVQGALDSHFRLSQFFFLQLDTVLNLGKTCFGANYLHTALPQLKLLTLVGMTQTSALYACTRLYFVSGFE